MKKFYYIIILSFFVRLYHITFPVSGWHSWRQSDTASIAKNFFENGFNIFYPQINWNGTALPYVESEFPIYPFIVSILYYLFGEDDMWGRFVSVICSVITVYLLYLIVKRIIDEKTALWSAFIYAIIPLNIYYGRAFMPESMMLMCSAAGIFYFLKWHDSDKIYELILSALFISMAILLKLPGFYLGLPLIYLVYKKYKFKGFFKPVLWIYFIIIIIPVILWYYHSHQLLLNGGTTFDIWNAGKSKWAMFELLLQPALYHDIIFKSIAERHLTYPGFILFAGGLFIKRKYPLEKLFDFWLIAVVIYIIIVPQGNRVHEYYQLPIIFPTVVFIAKILAKYIPSFNFKKNYTGKKLQFSIVVLFLLLIPVLSFLRLQNTLNAETYNSPVFKISEVVKANSGKNDLIITACDGNPVYLYRSDRKGWVVIPQNIDSLFLDNKYNEGAKLLTAEKKIFNTSLLKQKLDWLTKSYRILCNDEEVIVIDIRR